jgi:xylulokinase
MNRYVIGIDVGTTAIKLLVLNEQHKIVYEKNEEHPLFTDHPGWAEEDALLWWTNTCNLLKLATTFLMDSHRESAFQISAIGVSGMVPAIVLIGENGFPLRRSIQQNDARCVNQIKELSTQLNQEELYDQTGGYTNQQHVLPRLLWVKENEPDVWKNVQHVCGSYDWVVHCLTGEWSLEENWAVESGLYDIHNRKWITKYFNDFNIPISWFPAVQSPLNIVGYVHPDVLQVTGLNAGIPVIAGSADHVASALSAGVVDEGDVLIKFGGAGDILFCTNTIVTHQKMFFDLHNIPNKYLINGCMASSGSLVRWFVEQFVPNPIAGNVYQELDNQAERLGPGSEGLVVLPYLLGEKTPIFDPNARGVFFGLSLHHTPAHLFRAILESVIYGFKHHLDVLAEQGLHPKRVYATNGGAKSKLWLQIASDILDFPLTSYKKHPGSSLGVAFLAGIAIGLFFNWHEIQECLPESSEYKPNKQSSEIYNVSYGVYRRLYEALKEDFHLVSNFFREK